MVSADIIVSMSTQGTLALPDSMMRYRIGRRMSVSLSTVAAVPVAGKEIAKGAQKVIFHSTSMFYAPV